MDQDFAYEFGTVTGAIRDFALTDSEELVVGAIGGLVLLLATDVDEDRLDVWLRKAHCAYLPIGESRREWLGSVADRMVAAALERWPLSDD